MRDDNNRKESNEGGYYKEENSLASFSLGIVWFLVFCVVYFLIKII